MRMYENLSQICLNDSYSHRRNDKNCMVKLKGCFRRINKIKKASLSHGLGDAFVFKG